MRLLHKIQGLFERLVALVEEHPAPLKRYFQLFLAILSVRLALEFFSSQRLYRLEDILHIGLWFLFIVLAFLIQLHLFSGVPIQRTIRLCVVGFTIALTAPILDLVISGGQGAKMNYLDIKTWADVGQAYVTIGGPSLSRGATLGIRVEIVLLLVASFNYVRTKRRSIVWALAGALSIYTVLFASGAVPQLLGGIVHRFGLAYGHDDRSTLLLLLTLDLGLIAIAVWRYNGRLVGQLLAGIPWGAAALACMQLLAGAQLARAAYPGNWQWDPTTLFWPPLLLGLGMGMGLLASAQRLQARGVLGPAQATRVRNALLGWCMAIGIAVSSKVAFVVAVLWGILFLLNEPPLNLRRAPVLRNLLEALAVVAAGLIGFVTCGGPMIGYPAPLLFGTLLAVGIGGAFVDLGRLEDDALPGYRGWLGRQGKVSRGIGIALLDAAVVTGWLWAALPTSSAAVLVLALSLVAANACIWRWPRRPQAAIACLAPLYLPVSGLL